MINSILQPAQQAAFLDRSLLFGHNAASLLEGQEEVAYLTVNDLHMFGQWMSNAGEEEKALRLPTFFSPAIAGRSRLGQGMHDRGEAFVFAGAALEEKDSRGLANHMPFHLKAISVMKKVVKRDETWDVSVRGEVWGLDEMEELYVALNVGVLILEPGARVVVRGNVFSMLCQRVICMPDDTTTTPPYHIGILPTPFSVDYGEGPHDGPDGSPGAHGRNGKDGKQAMVEKNLIGYKLMEHIDPAEMNGEDGTDGGRGKDGVKGRNGGMAKLAELTFREVEGVLSVFSQAGKGGNGGNGGDGGTGGNGGAGAPGYKLIRGILPDGADGKGGDGGQGGNGGNAGHGGLSSNIYITVPEADTGKIIRTSLAAEGGSGGMGGSPGKGGAGSNGNDGRDGSSGKQGMAGRSRPAATIFLNGHI